MTIRIIPTRNIFLDDGNALLVNVPVDLPENEAQSLLQQGLATFAEQPEKTETKKSTKSTTTEPTENP